MVSIVRVERYRVWVAVVVNGMHEVIHAPATGFIVEGHGNVGLGWFALKVVEVYLGSCGIQGLRYNYLQYIPEIIFLLHIKEFTYAAISITEILTANTNYEGL